MIALYVRPESTGFWRYWNTYSNDNHIDEALDRAEEEYGKILEWHVVYLTNEC